MGVVRASMIGLIVLEMSAGGALGQRGNRQQRRDRRERDGERSPLKVGDEAPNFKLDTVDAKDKEQDKNQSVELATFRGKKPVVLIFGSYT